MFHSRFLLICCSLWGASIVNAVVFSREAISEMLQHGYSLRLSLGSIAAADQATKIPPSLTMVIYAVITEQSIGQMLLAGILSAILSICLFGYLSDSNQHSSFY